MQADNRVLDIANDVSRIHRHIEWIVPVVVCACCDGIERTARRFPAPKCCPQQLNLTFQARRIESTWGLIQIGRPCSPEREVDGTPVLCKRRGEKWLQCQWRVRQMTTDTLPQILESDVAIREPVVEICPMWSLRGWHCRFDSHGSRLNPDVSVVCKAVTEDVETVELRDLSRGCRRQQTDDEERNEPEQAMSCSWIHEGSRSLVDGRIGHDLILPPCTICTISNTQRAFLISASRQLSPRARR